MSAMVIHDMDGVCSQFYNVTTSEASGNRINPLPNSHSDTLRWKLAMEA